MTTGYVKGRSYVECDKCGETFEHAGSMGELWNEPDVKDWRSIKRGNIWSNYCLSCAPARDTKLTPDLLNKLAREPKPKPPGIYYLKINGKILQTCSCCAASLVDKAMIHVIDEQYSGGKLCEIIPPHTISDCRAAIKNNH